MSYVVEKDYKGFKKKTYRKGKPEGVVMHDTANDNSVITGEISYMTRVYPQKGVFVHAFADHSRIIEIADTAYMCQGAGKYANPRFFQIELCHSKTKEQFIEAFNRWCYWSALKLVEEGLPATPAQPDGTGTIWSHNLVTKYLGDSTHTDPDGYLARWGYTWQDAVNKVIEFYNEIKGVKPQPAPQVDFNKAILDRLHFSNVKELQSVLGVTADGIIGPITNGVIQQVLNKSVCKRGSKGVAVRYIQFITGAMPPDGIFGPNTQAHVIAWQKKNGLVADGVVGPKTWAKMIG
jgi:hypothetical protein